jgi:receptor protein-tyrosine kinase
MGVSDYVRIIRRRWRIVVVTALIGALLGGAYTFAQEEQYTSTSQLFVAIADQSGNDPLQAGQAAQQRLVSYASLATGQAVTQGVIDQLDLDATTGEVASHITVQYPPGTVLLNISTTGDTAAQARELNGAVDDQLQAVVRRLESVPGGAAPGATLSVVDPPSEGTAAGRSAALIILLGLIVGLVLGAVIAFIRDRSKRTVDTSADLTRALGVAVVGPVDPTRPADTDVRLLRTKILSAINAENGSRTVLLTGSEVDTAVIAGAVATALGNAAQRVVVVDARSDSQPASGTREPGLGEILRGNADLRECVQARGGTSLSFVAAGDLSGTTVDLLASPAFAGLLDELETTADVVLVHAGELASSPEVVSIASRPVIAVIAIPLGTFDERTVVARTSDLRAAAATTIGVALLRQPPPGSHRGRFSRPGKSRTSSGRENTPTGADQYPIVAAPYSERSARSGSASRGEPEIDTREAGDWTERQGHRR